jgi:hypothetical protein
MGLFRKEQHIKVVLEKENGDYKRRLIKTGDRMGESRTPVSDALLATQPKTKEKKKPSRLIKIGKAIDKKIVAWNRSQGKRGPYSFDNNANPFGSIFDSGIDDTPKVKTKYIIRGGKAYPIAGSGKKKKGKKKQSGFELPDFDLTDNWNLFK